MLGGLLGAENITVSKSSHSSYSLRTYSLVDGAQEEWDGRCVLGLGGHV